MKQQYHPLLEAHLAQNRRSDMGLDGESYPSVTRLDIPLKRDARLNAHNLLSPIRTLLGWTYLPARIGCRTDKRRTQRVASVAAAILAWMIHVDASADTKDLELRRFRETHITKAQWHKFFDETRSKPDAVMVDRVQLTRIVVPREAAVYVFTKPSHPAHPAAVRRAIVSYGNKAYVHTSGYYAGSRAEFAAWIDQFIEHDRRLQRNLRDRSAVKLLLVRASEIGI